MLTWLLIIIIVGLCAFIVIRDKKMREAVMGLFLRVKKKIRIARIKAKINKENEKKQELIKNLGEETCIKGVDAGFVAAERNKADELAKEKKKIEREIEKRNAEMEKNTKSFEEFEKKQDGLIKEQEEKLEPLEKELSQVKKELHSSQKEIADKEKQKEKFEKKIASQRQKTEEIEKDEDLSKIEKQEKREEIEKTIKEFESSRAAIVQELESSRREKPEKEKKPAELEPRVRAFEEKIKALKEEKKAEEKKVDEMNSGLRTSRNTLISKQSQLKKELDSLFETIGEKINNSRVENSDLLPLYTRIDDVDKTIKELEKQVEKAKLPAPAD